MKWDQIKQACSLNINENMPNTYPTEIRIKWKAACINTTTSTWNTVTSSDYGIIYSVQLCCHICLKSFKLSNTHIDTYQVIIYQQGSCNQKQNISKLSNTFIYNFSSHILSTKQLQWKRWDIFNSFLTLAFILFTPLFYQQSSSNVKYEIFKLSKTCIYSSRAIFYQQKSCNVKYEILKLSKTCIQSSQDII